MYWNSFRQSQEHVWDVLSKGELGTRGHTGLDQS